MSQPAVIWRNASCQQCNPEAMDGIGENTAYVGLFHRGKPGSFVLLTCRFEPAQQIWNGTVLQSLDKPNVLLAT